MLTSGPVFPSGYPKKVIGASSFEIDLSSPVDPSAATTGRTLVDPDYYKFRVFTNGALFKETQIEANVSFGKFSPQINGSFTF